MRHEGRWLHAELPQSPPADTGKTAAPSSDAAPRERYVLSMRPSIGFGSGRLGGGERVGVAGEYWFNDEIGGGLVGAVMQQQTGALIDLGPGTWSAAWVLAPVIALRSAPRSSYFIATLGAGYASVTRQTHGGFLCLGGCGPERRTEYGGYALESSIGWLGHPGQSQFEIGPVVRFEALGDFRGAAPVDYLATLNLELGFALKR